MARRVRYLLEALISVCTVAAMDIIRSSSAFLADSSGPEPWIPLWQIVDLALVLGSVSFFGLLVWMVLRRRR
jgi:hypothetical protein